MLEGQVPVQRESAHSALTWWVDAGVDMLVDEVPVPWLDRHAPRPRPAEPPAPELRPAATLAELTAQLRGLSALDDLVPRDHRIAASGTPGSDLMILIDMPEPDDWREGVLIGGDAGVLFEAMLKAIGRDRASCYIAAMCPARLPGGSIPHDLNDLLAGLLRRHVALAAPARLWSMGMAANRAVIGADAVPGRGNLRHFNHDGRNVTAVASFSPRMLIQQPKRKAAAWADMQALMRGSET